MHGWRGFWRIFGVENEKIEMCIYLNLLEFHLNFLPLFVRILEFHLNSA
jgi:hypothetical protein